MRSKLNYTVVIDRPPAHVFTWLPDFSKWPQWEGGLASMEQISPGPLRVGSQIRQVRTSGKPAESLSEVVQFVPDRLIGMKSTGHPVSFQGTFALEPVDAGTRLVVQFEINADGFIGLISYLVMKLTVKQELDKFKALVEAR